MSEPTAKAVGTLGIWVATALILVLGVFRANWNGDVAMLLMLVVVVVVCSASTISTAAVWNWERINPLFARRSGQQQRTAEPCAALNVGPGERPGNSGASGGPPSVS